MRTRSGSRPISPRSLAACSTRWAACSVALDVMAGAGQAAGHGHAVRTLFQRVQDFQHAGASGAGHLDDLDGRGIAHAAAACQVGG